MKRDEFIFIEAGFQAAERDYNTYGKDMRENYPEWDDNRPFEAGYDHFFFRKKTENVTL